MPHTDLEKGCIMTDDVRDKDPTGTNNLSNNPIKHRNWSSSHSTTLTLTIAYTTLYLTNYYLAPSGPGSQHRSSDSGRIQPLIIILMLLAPDIIQKAFAITTTSAQNESPCFGFGWLAYSVGLMVPVVSGRGSASVPPQQEEDVRVANIEVKTRRGQKNMEEGPGVLRLLSDLEARCVPDTDDSGTLIVILEPSAQPSPRRSFCTIMQTRSMTTGLFQFCLAGLFWYYYGDLSVLLLLSTSILLLEATVTVNPHRLDQASAQTTSVPAVILISGGFLSQALLCTQVSDPAAVVMSVIMFCGTIGNVAIAALPREPQVNGVKLQIIDVIGGGGVV